MQLRRKSEDNITQDKRRIYLIQRLIDEQPRYRDTQIPQEAAEQKRLLRSLMNVHMPKKIGENFADFEEKYGFHDMYSGGFCRFDTPEEQWAYWSRFITLNRYTDAPKPVYEESAQPFFYLKCTSSFVLKFPQVDLPICRISP